MSAEERLAKITGLYKASSEEEVKEKPKIQFASETVDPRVAEIKDKYVPVEFSCKETKTETVKEPVIEVDLVEKSLTFSNEFSLRLLMSFILGIFAAFQPSDNLEFIGTIFTSFQVLGSIQELYSSKKYMYNEYLKMVGLGNDRLDLLIRIYDAICSDIYMFIFTYGLTMYLLQT